MKKEHRNKMIAPIIITAIMILYYVAYFAICMLIPIHFVVKLLFGIIPLLFSGVCIYVLVERIKEIRSGEEDDLSKY